jgi:hypothetical protein
LQLNKQVIDQWRADQDVPTPTTRPDALLSTRRTIPGLPTRPGDFIRVAGRAGGDERAAIDYLELVPESAETGQNTGGSNE